MHDKWLPWHANRENEINMSYYSLFRYFFPIILDSGGGNGRSHAHLLTNFLFYFLILYISNIKFIKNGTYPKKKKIIKKSERILTEDTHLHISWFSKIPSKLRIWWHLSSRTIGVTSHIVAQWKPGATLANIFCLHLTLPLPPRPSQKKKKRSWSQPIYITLRSHYVSLLVAFCIAQMRAINNIYQSSYVIE